MTGLGSEHLAELLREFEDSRWETMTLSSEQLSVAVSRHGRVPPPPVLGAAPAATGAAGPPVDGAGAAPSAASRPTGVVSSTPATPTPARTATALAEHLTEVRSPVLGTFYVAPKPGAPPLAQVGQIVAAEDTVAIVEVMKLMNHVAAGVTGEIVEVCATNGQMVQFDEVLFRIRPVER